MRIVMWVAIVFVVLESMLLLYRHELVLLAVNAAGGCYPWSPKVVEYHDGMTICPGQRAVQRLLVLPPTSKLGGI